MDGSVSGSYDAAWTTDDEFGGWWRVDFPYKIALTKLTNYNAPSSSSAYLKGQYFTDETRTVPIGDLFTAWNAWEVFAIYDDPENPIMTRSIYSYKQTGNRWSGIGEAVLEAASMTYEARDGR
jgi:hypothetical protein